MAGNVVTEKIGKSIELIIEGLPKSMVTPEVQAKAALSLVKYGIPAAGVIGQGVLGGVKTAALKIGSEIYQIKYSIIVLRALTALEIFSEAVQWVEFQKTYNRVDSEMADDTIAFLRERLRKEQQSWLDK